MNPSRRFNSNSNSSHSPGLITNSRLRWRPRMKSDEMVGPHPMSDKSDKIRIALFAITLTILFLIACAAYFDQLLR
jgi:hypothetical protein